MINTATPSEPTTTEILEWFGEAGIHVEMVGPTLCDSCATPAAA